MTGSASELTRKHHFAYFWAKWPVDHDLLRGVGGTAPAFIVNDTDDGPPGRELGPLGSVLESVRRAGRTSNTRG